MSTPRPSKLPRWATLGVKTEPTEAYKDIGYTPKTKPPAQVENWWKDDVAQWIGFFDSSVGAGLFGDGSDGTITMDGTTAVVGTTLSGTTYTANRDMHFLELTVNSGITFVTANYRIFVQDTLTNSGHIHCDGSAGVLSSGHTAIASGTLLGGTAGGVGGNVSLPNGGAAASNPSTSTTGGGGGGNGGGGGQPGSTYTGGAGGTVYSSTLSRGRDIVSATVGGVFALSSGMMQCFPIAGGTGGGGGGYGQDSGTNASYGGGGGSGAGSMVLAAHTIVNNGSISCNGGAGAAPSIENGSGDNAAAGGGGGGGGGNIALVHEGLSGTGTITVSGGAAGSATGSTPANAGAVGHICEFDLSLGSGQAALGPHKEGGVVSFATGSTGPGYDFVDVTFTTAFPDLTYQFDFAQSLTSGTDPVPVAMINQTQYGFRLVPLTQFSGRISWSAKTLGS